MQRSMKQNVSNLAEKLVDLQATSKKEVWGSVPEIYHNSIIQYLHDTAQ